MTPKEGCLRLALASLHIHACTHRHTQRNMNTHMQKRRETCCLIQTIGSLKYGNMYPDSF